MALVAVVPAMICAAPAAPAQGPASTSAAFVYLAGTDTIGVERFTRTIDRLLGDVTLRGQPRITYDAELTGPGHIATLTVSAFAPNAAPEAPPLQRASIHEKGDTVLVDMLTNGVTRTLRLPSRPGVLPVVNGSLAMIELALERARAAGADSASVPMFFTSGGQTLTAVFRRVTPDSVVVHIGPQESSLITAGSRVVRVRIPLQNLVGERIEGTAVAALRVGKPDYSPPAGAPYRAESVRVPTPAGYFLVGTLTMPLAARGRVPAVVTITGSGPQDRDEYIPVGPGYRPFRQVADTLGRRGIAVLRLDDRGTGESGGNFATATSADFADDIRAAVAWLRTRPDIDPDRIALLGHSEGGLIAPLVASTDPRIAALVLLAGPAETGRQILEYQRRYAIEHDSSIAVAGRDSAFRAATAMFDTTAARQPWLRYFLTYDPLATAAKVKAPVLILQGATDRQVTPDQAPRLAAAFRQAGNRDVELRIYPDHDHLFLHDRDGNPTGYAMLPSATIGPEVMGQIADWLAAKLGRH